MVDWLRRIRQILRLSQRGVLVLIEGARADHLPALMRAIGGARGDVPVCFEPWEIEALPDGATTLFVPAATHAAELNAARPIFADRALRVLVWAEPGVSAALARGAPDFFDWISHRVECPAGMATFFVEGVRVARAVGVGGVLVSEPSTASTTADSGDDDLLDDDDEALGLIWYDESDLAKDWRIELAFEAGGRLPVVLRDSHDALDEPGWWWLDHRPVESVRSLSGLKPPTRQALLLLGGEPSSIAWMKQLLEKSERVSPDLAAAISSPRRLAEMALDRGLISRDALMLGTAPALLRRGYFGGKTHPRRVLQQWSKRKTAPVGWQVIFAPKVLLAQPDDGSVALGPALIEHYVRTGDRERMFRDDRAIRAIRSLGEGELRGQVLAWVGRREGRAQESARDILLRALERAAHEDLRAARVLLEISLDRRDIDLATVVAAMAARVRILTIQGDLKSALQLGDWEFNDVPFEDRATLRRLQKVNAPGLAEWLHARARCALEDHNLDLTRMERRELTNLIERRRLGGQSRALLLDLDVRLSLARGETERALKHLEALAAIPGIDAPTILFAEAMLQAGRVLVARGLLDRVSVRRSLDSLDEVIQFTLVFGRVALAAGDIKAADDAVEGLPKRLESAMGEGSLSAAKVDQLRAEIAMARARYSQADMLAVRAEHVFRTRLDADHPTRIENELFRKIIPGHDPEPGALLALDRLSRVLGPAHPSVVQWRLRVGAAVARKARVERSSSN